MPLAAGDAAPDFDLLDQHGEHVTLGGLLEAGPVVLFWYPAALTAGCTRESCHFRDLAAEFADAGGQRIGISADDPDRQLRFDEKHGLGYPLLSDADGTVARAYGVNREKKGLIMKGNRRTTFVIDTDGTILEVVASELNMNVHADRALAALRARTGA